MDESIPRYVQIFYIDRGRWPTLDEVEFEHEWRYRQAVELWDRGAEAEQRGAPRTHLAALKAEYQELEKVLIGSRAYIADIYKRRDADVEGRIAARERRWERLFRRYLGYVPPFPD